MPPPVSRHRQRPPLPKSCDDSDYFSSPAGVKFKDCLECLQTSEEATGSESDSSWLICKSSHSLSITTPDREGKRAASSHIIPQDNLRFASAVCLYDYPKHEKNSSSCDLGSACLPLQTALETGLALATSPSSAFGYCSADNSAFYGTSIDDCVSCLQSSSDTYGANCEYCPQQTSAAAGPELIVIVSLSSPPRVAGGL